MGTVVGIDFGGSRLRIAADGRESPIILDNPYASKRLPFVVNSATDGGAKGGSPWQISSLKRLLDFDKVFPLSPTGINSIDYLAELLVEACRSCLGDRKLSELRAVVAVPPCFSQRQRSSLYTAASRAGFSVVRLVDDTLAALLAQRQDVRDYRHILVFSWGASSCSIGLYRCRGDTFQIVAQEGDRNLGGDDVDGFLAGLLWPAFARLRGSPEPKPNRELARFAQIVERAKHSLASGESVTISSKDFPGSNLSSIAPPRSVSLTQEDWTGVITGMISLAMRRLEAVLAMSNNPEPDAVLLTGGMTLVPEVQKWLAGRIQTPLIRASQDAVALGALFYGRGLAESEWSKGDKTGADHAVSGPGIREESTDRWADHFIPFLNTAQEQEKQGQIEAAVATFERLFVELNTFSSTLYRQVASTLEKAGRLDEALRLMHRHLRRDRRNSSVAADLVKLCLKRSAQAYKDRQFTAAMSDANLAIEVIRPSTLQGRDTLLAEATYLRGLCLFALGRLLEAEKALEESERLWPTQEHYKQDLAKIRLHLKKSGSSKIQAGKTGRIGRNSPCPCGSGLKYKKCCAGR